MLMTIIVPEALIPDARQLARVLGARAADENTYRSADWSDAAGNRYAVASGVVGENFTSAAQTQLVAPPWGADMEAAARAQMRVKLALAPEPASPSVILAVPLVAAARVISAAGLTRLEQEEGAAP